MTALIRSSFRSSIPHGAEQAHAGLWLMRGLPEFSESPESKARHIDSLCQQRPSEFYKLAWRRWLDTIGDTDRFSSLHVQLAQRLFIGQSSASVLETGICVSHSYGMPMVPGSTVKGCAQAYARAVGLSPEYRAVLFGEDEESAEGSKRLPGAACLIWHDAWWNPDSGTKPFVREIVTTHHMEYYAGKTDEATDFDSPVPNAQIAAQGSFCFAIEGPYAWTKLGIDLLEKALRETGIGAKRAAGYGVMKKDEEATRRLQDRQRQQAEEKMTPLERARSRIGILTGKMLAQTFGRDLNKTRAEYAPLADDELRLIALECHGAIIEKWVDADKNENKGKAYRFLKSPPA
ncbi:MAG: type III-B CRISPR module RAMP protein Cmr6 [Zoogloeaceae bacterium]|jgi:CRISPR-associated protein Cmr6|nr:type III-B CRISPR module RAMP protein Cmr6 [Zoogloeaceae bacterium]